MCGHATLASSKVIFEKTVLDEIHFRIIQNLDFHSCYFWPWSGTNEDPVTGGTHNFLGKYLADQLNKSKMKSIQSSDRTGFMDVKNT